MDEPRDFWGVNGLKVTTVDSHGNLGTDVIPRLRPKWPDGPCYIAGPMRRVPEFNFPAFFDAEDQLKREHATVGLNPARFDIERGCSPWGKTGFESIEALGYDYIPAMAHGLEYIRSKAEWVCVLPGWETSDGSKKELGAAFNRGIPVLLFPNAEPLTEYSYLVGRDGPRVEPMVQDASTPAQVATTCIILEPGQLCSQASDIVAGARRKAYGPPEHNFERIAILHEAWDAVVATVPKGTISGPVNVAVKNVLQKLARIAETPSHTDSWRDVAGYADCGARCAGCDPSK